MGIALLQRQVAPSICVLQHFNRKAQARSAHEGTRYLGKNICDKRKIYILKSKTENQRPGGDADQLRSIQFLGGEKGR